MRRWRVANLERIRERRRLFRAAYPERVRETQQRWRQANREQCNEKRRQQRLADPANFREASRRYYEANAAYRKRQRERNQRQMQKMRAALLALRELGIEV